MCIAHRPMVSHRECKCKWTFYLYKLFTVLATFTFHIQL